MADSGRANAIEGDGRYPLAMGPLTWAVHQQLFASDAAADDYLGYSVALSGDTALVGAYGNDDAGDLSGSAYVFVRNATSWTEQQKLMASDGAAADYFGWSVALSGENALVGARGDDDAGPYSGAAYVFVRNAESWTEQQKLVANAGASLNHVGFSVALDGNTALLGAPGSDGGSYAGSAYVFVRNAQSWTQQQKVIASDRARSDIFGESVALNGDTIVVGAQGKGDLGSNAGAAYVFARSAASWSQQNKILASDGEAYDRFGESVAISSDTILVGARGAAGASAKAGSAYVFVRAAGSWAEHQRLVASDGADSDFFGHGLAVSGEIALVGAWGVDDAGNNSGAAYVFARAAGSWAQDKKLMARNAAAEDVFGYSLALSGDTALIGAYGNGDVGNDAGTAHLVALRLVDGEACSDSAACASQSCLDGICCDGICDGPCETCNAIGLEGTCTPLVRGSSPVSSCNGYLCDGTLSGCPKNCRGDGECSAEHHCRSGTACLPKAVDGQLCTGHGACLSGHCVDGICCDEACDEGCGSCRASGLEGVCSPLEAGHPGGPSCAPYLCAGDAAACPSGCVVHRDCDLGSHCAAGACQLDEIQGAACSEGDACSTGHCADGVCCVADSCGPYRCGPAGVCEAACGSSAQCARNHQCNSAGKCEPRVENSSPGNESGACQFTGVVASARGRLSWLGGLFMLACLGFAQRRRRGKRGRLGLGGVLVGITSLGAQGCSPQEEGARDRWGQQSVALVDDAGTAPASGSSGGVARYPLNVAPLRWTEQQRLVASDGATGDLFGESVSLDGDTALVGARIHAEVATNAGAAYVFVRAANSWSSQQELLAVDGAAGDQFGYSVSVFGETALVGAFGRSDSGTYSGAAYVFQRAAAIWAQQQKLLASDGAAADFFGWNVSLDGETALVGAYGDDDAGSFSGSAYVFVRSASVWAQQQKLAPSGHTVGELFGDSVTVRGDTALVGAQGKRDAGPYSGAVYVFERTAATWAQQQKLVASDGASPARFGTSLAMNGDTMLVGARGDETSGSDAGGAYVFVRNASGWAEEQKLLASDGAAEDYFGESVSVRGDTALVGAQGKRDAGIYSGAAYVFSRNASTWVEDQKLLASDGSEFERFGKSVSLADGVALVGAHGSDEGSAYLLDLRLVAGEPCAGIAACASKFCVDGVCCAGVCDGPCETCNEVGFEGSCKPAHRGAEPASSCNGYLCDGVANGCPEVCAGDADCGGAHHCQNAVACLPKGDDGEACSGHAGCLSGHCVDGVCCAEACGEGCGSCVVAGHEGSCTPLEAGHPGTPLCAPYLCGGGEVGCASSCSVHRDCAIGSHCEEDACQPDGEQGAACDVGDVCASGHCTDGVCCLVDSCGAYRCSSEGVCEAACSSSAQCASGYQCNSSGTCVPREAGSGAADESGACHLASASAGGHSSARWPAGLAWLACLGLVRRRHRPTLGP